MNEKKEQPGKGANIKKVMAYVSQSLVCDRYVSGCGVREKKREREGRGECELEQRTLLFKEVFP